MSVINRFPAIMALVGSLTEAQIGQLANMINGGTPASFRSLINPAYRITNADKGVSHVTLETKDHTYTGYLVYNDEYCMLISYVDDQQGLNMIRINLSDWSYELVGEYLDINEFRDVIQKGTEEVRDVSVSDIVSGSEDPGKVIMSDGAGGAEWAPLYQTEANILRFENVDFDTLIESKTSAWTAALTITAADWAKLTDTTKNGIVILEVNSDEIVLQRAAVEPNRVIFTMQHSNVEDIQDYSAVFTHIGDDYAGVAIQSTMLEANNVGDDEYAYLHAITVNGETYLVLNPTELDAILEEYAKVDGNYPTMSVGRSDLADNLIATKGLTVNDDPMSFGMVGGAQKSAVGDGNASLNKLVCVDVVKNQITPAKAAETMTTTDTGLVNKYLQGGAINLAHEYLIIIKITSITNGSLRLRYPAIQNLSVGTNFVLVTSPNHRDMMIQIASEEGNEASFVFPDDYLKTIDLTQRYGNNDVVNTIIGTDASTQVARLLAFDPEILKDLSYDAGTLVPSKTAKLLSVGVNQWDEEWELGYYDVSSNGAFRERSDGICSKRGEKFPLIPAATYSCELPTDNSPSATILFFDKSDILLSYVTKLNGQTFTAPKNAEYYIFYMNQYGTTYNHDICINVSDPNINGKYYPSKRTPVTLPNYEGHGILKVVDGKVVADGTELYPDGNSKKRFSVVDLGTLTWAYDSDNNQTFNAALDVSRGNPFICPLYVFAGDVGVGDLTDKTGLTRNGVLYLKNVSYTDAATFKSAMSGVYLVYELATEEDITTSVFQSTFPVEQGGTLQFLDEDDNPIAGLQGSEIFYQKNLKAFTEAFGEAIGWDPARIQRLANLSFTPEYRDLTITPTPTGSFARAQVVNSMFNIVISAAFTGTPSSNLVLNDIEVDLSGWETDPAASIYDMEGNPVSAAPTTADCNIASFVGRVYNGTMLWSLLHSDANKIKIHFEQAVPLDTNGDGKIDCRASLIL